jgi:hypothetical protein
MNQHQVDIVELELREILPDRRIRILSGSTLVTMNSSSRSRPQALIASPMPRCV